MAKMKAANWASQAMKPHQKWLKSNHRDDILLRQQQWVIREDKRVRVVIPKAIQVTADKAKKVFECPDIPGTVLYGGKEPHS